MRAYTLLELLIAVIIIGILASFAIPNYIKAKEHALGNEAKANLKLMAAAEQIKKIESGSFLACSCFVTGTDDGRGGCNGPTWGCNTQLNLTLNPNNWSYYVPSFTYGGYPGTPSHFLIVAYRHGYGGGGYLNCAYWLADTDADGEPDPQGNCP